MNGVCFTFDDSSLVCANSRNDEINRSAYSFGFESLHCSGVVGLFCQDLPQQPQSGNGVIFEHTDEVVGEVLGVSGVAVDSERARSDSGEREDTAHHDVAAEDALVSSVVLDICQQLCQELPHLEVQISTVDHLSLGSSHEQPGACSEGGILVHEIEEKYLFEG